MSKSVDAFRTISEVADWLGIPAHVLRFWESKFTQVKPVKRAGGRRYYRPADMLLLGGIRKLLHDDGMTIKGVQKVMREQGVKYVAALSPDLDGEIDIEESDIALDVPSEPIEGDASNKVLPFDRPSGRAASQPDATEDEDLANAKDAQDTPASTRAESDPTIAETDGPIDAAPKPEAADTPSTDTDANPDSMADDVAAEDAATDEFEKAHTEQASKVGKPKTETPGDEPSLSDEDAAQPDLPTSDSTEHRPSDRTAPNVETATRDEPAPDIADDCATDLPPEPDQSHTGDDDDATPIESPTRPVETPERAEQQTAAAPDPATADADQISAQPDAPAPARDTAPQTVDVQDAAEPPVPTPGAAPASVPDDPADTIPAPPSVLTALAARNRPLDADTRNKVSDLASRLRALRTRSAPQHKG
jgi:DNA-binding transcriptional MerR regulator